MRRKKTQPFDDYLYASCERLHQLGGDVDVSLTAAAGIGSRVILEARVTFPDELELLVFEVIEVTEDGGAHRRKYRYQARWHGQLLVRFERDPVGHPEMPEHKHTVEGERVPCESVTPPTVAYEMWQECERRRNLRLVADAEPEHDAHSRSA